jgi:hypothetical protein
MASEQQIFKRLVSLVGQKVEAKTSTSSKLLTGTIENTMFDSFILRTGNSNQVIPFSKLLYIKTL